MKSFVFKDSGLDCLQRRQPSILTAPDPVQGFTVLPCQGGNLGNRSTRGGVGIKPFDDVHGRHSTNIFVEVNHDNEDIPGEAKLATVYSGGMGLYDQIKAELAAREPNHTALAKKANIKHDQVRSLFSGRNVGIRDVAAMLEAVGARILFPGDRPETTRDVCWVDAKVVAAGEGQPMPSSESYFAVPLVGEAGAGPGVMSDDTIKSWVLVYRHQHAVRLKSNLLAVEIGKGSTSMTPLLCPGDIILVDRDDFKPAKPGGIFLVREPGQQGGAMIKRVAVKPVDHDLLITFYSENTAENPPETFSLKADFNDKITDAIVGRCVWAWSDITGK